MTLNQCRHCGSLLNHPVIDLGHQPPSNAYLRPDHLALPELTYPLRVFVCTSCWLVQLPSHASADQLLLPITHTFQARRVRGVHMQKSSLILLRIVCPWALKA